jgi:hypothetical protein
LEEFGMGLENPVRTIFQNFWAKKRLSRVMAGLFGVPGFVSYAIVTPNHLVLDQNGCFWPVLFDFKVATPVGLQIILPCEWPHILGNK